MDQSQEFEYLEAKGEQSYLAVDQKGRTPFSVALENGHLDVVAKLLQVASGNSYHKLAKQIIEVCSKDQTLKRKILDPDPTKVEGVTPLMLACQMGPTNVALELLPHVYSPQDPSGTSPLDLAISKGNVVVVEAILKKLIRHWGEASVANTINREAPDHSSPLIRAASRGDVEMVKLLLRAGGDPLQSYEGTSALSIATQYQNHTLLNLFKPYVKFHETEVLIDRISSDFAERKPPKLPRDKLKHELIRQALSILRDKNVQQGGLSTYELRTTPINLSEFHLEAKQKQTFTEHLGKLRGRSGEAFTSLQEILDFHTKPMTAFFKKKPKSSQQVLRETSPGDMSSEARRFIKDVVDRLKRSPDLASSKEKRTELKQRRLEKIERLEKLYLRLETLDCFQCNPRTLKELCELRVEESGPTILEALNMHRDPSKEGIKETKSYQEFYKLFRLDKHPEVDASRAVTETARKGRESLDGESPSVKNDGVDTNNPTLDL